jgi:hypothetical protein
VIGAAPSFLSAGQNTDGRLLIDEADDMPPNKSHGPQNGKLPRQIATGPPRYVMVQGVVLVLKRDLLECIKALSAD